MQAMLVEFVDNTYRLPDGDLAGGDYLVLGGEYVVHAIGFLVSGIHYFIMDNSGDGYPIAYPAQIFKVVDGRMPPYWAAGGAIQHSPKECMISFSEWAQQDDFYEKMLDDSPRENGIFQKRMQEDFAFHGFSYYPIGELPVWPLRTPSHE